MRTVKHTRRFRRDYKREMAGRHSRRLDADLLEAVTLLAQDQPLPQRYFDHPLGGEWNDCRDFVKDLLKLSARLTGGENCNNTCRFVRFINQIKANPDIRLSSRQA